MMRDRLGQEARQTALAFNEASDRADDSLSMIKSSLVTGGDKNARAIVELFLEFNKLGKRLAPPESFSPAKAAAETKSGFKSVLRRAANMLQTRGVELPPTIEQWLAIYQAESPDFIKMREQIQRALDDVSTRSRAARIEIGRLEALIREQEEKYQDMSIEAQAHEANLVNLDPELQADVRRSILTPLLRDMGIIQEYIGNHKAIVLQKKLILQGSEDVVDELIPTVNMALPTLRNSAIAAEDAMTNRRLAEATDEMRKLVRSSLLHTSKLIGSTADEIAALRSSAIVGPEHLSKVVLELVRAADVTRQSLDLQLPNLKARIDSYEKLSTDMSRMIRRIPTATPLQIANPSTEATDDTGSGRIPRF